LLLKITGAVDTDEPIGRPPVASLCRRARRMRAAANRKSSAPPGNIAPLLCG